MANLHKNIILTGFIESFCLVCEDLLRSEEDANNHITKPGHKKNVEITPYLEKYKDDHIRKVKTGYYCEFCNVLILTAAKVGLHVAEDCHRDSRGSQQLKRVGDVVVALEKIVINKQAWHGLIDDTCVICNMEFDDELIHCTEQNHVLNLVLKKLGFGIGKAISRMIDDTSFQCLTCNQIFAIDTFTTHFETEEHKTFLKCCIEAKKQIAVDEQKSHKNPTEENAETSKQNKISDDNKQIAIPNILESSSSESLDECANFAKQNQLTYNKDNSNAFCRICQTKVPSSLKSMKEHVSGTKHKSETPNLSTKKPFIQKKPMKHFMDNAITIQNIFYADVVVNDKICVSHLSFVMITVQIHNVRCQTCEVNLDKDDVNNHIKTWKHRDSMEKTPVICKFDSEFVREIRPELFHCGFCNLIVGHWDDLEHHLKCNDHRLSKDLAMRRLQSHMPDVLKFREEKKMEELFMRMLLGQHRGRRF